MASGTLFRIFVQDVDSEGYRGVTDRRAPTAHDAVVWADRIWPHWHGKHIALPHDRKDLWPDEAGCVPPEALTFK